MVSVQVSLNLKRSQKILPQETMSPNENCFAPELNEKEVIEILENATPGSIKKATKYCLIIFHGKNLKTFSEHFEILLKSISVYSQSKTEVETSYTFKNYLYIEISGFFSKNKVEKTCPVSWGRFS